MSGEREAADARKIAQNRAQDEIAEDAMQSVGKAAKTFWNFLTSPDDKEFFKKLDHDHGTNLGELHARIKAGPVASMPLEPMIDRAIHPVGYHEARDRVGRAPEADADEVVIVVEDDAPCDFCKGKQVIQLKGTTRTAIKCPTCKKNPSAKPRELKR